MKINTPLLTLVLLSCMVVPIRDLGNKFFSNLVTITTIIRMSIT